MRALTGRRAAALLASDVAVFEGLGYRRHEEADGFAVTLRAPARDRGREPGGAGDEGDRTRDLDAGDRTRDLVVALTREGRVFGGNWGLEVSTAEPVLPPTPGGLAARGRGVVRMHGVRFRPRRRGDAAARALAEALSADEELGRALGRVHFERILVRPDGRPVIRHLGGSLVWVIFPPIVRATPLPPGQAGEMVRALAAFARAGRSEGQPGGGAERRASAGAPRAAGATARAHQASKSHSA